MLGAQRGWLQNIPRQWDRFGFSDQKPRMAQQGRDPAIASLSASVCQAPQLKTTPWLGLYGSWAPEQLRVMSEGSDPLEVGVLGSVQGCHTIFIGCNHPEVDRI